MAQVENVFVELDSQCVCVCMHRLRILIELSVHRLVPPHGNLWPPCPLHQGFCMSWNMFFRFSWNLLSCWSSRRFGIYCFFPNYIPWVSCTHSILLIDGGMVSLLQAHGDFFVAGRGRRWAGLLLHGGRSPGCGGCQRAHRQSHMTREVKRDPRTFDVWPLNLTFQRLNGDLNLAPIWSLWQDMVKLHSTCEFRSNFLAPRWRRRADDSIMANAPSAQAKRADDRVFTDTKIDVSWTNNGSKCWGNVQAAAGKELMIRSVCLLSCLPYPACVSLVFLKHLTLWAT